MSRPTRRSARPQRPRRPRRQHERRRCRRARARRRRLGLRRDARGVARRRRASARPRARDRREPARGVRWTADAGRPGARALAVLARASTRSTCRSRTSSRCCSPPRRRCAATRGSSARTPRAQAAACARRSPRPRAPPARRSGSSAAARSSPIAVDGDELQVRSYPGSHGGSAACAGLGARARPRPRRTRAARRRGGARAARRAGLPAGARDRDPRRRAARPADPRVDRPRARARPHALMEASYAGTSWVVPADLGRLRYGSERLNITADATLAGGLGTFGWDDEGVAAARTPLIEAGLLRAALSDRGSAAAIGLDRSGGCARADGFARQPIVRMTNVSIEPGAAGTLADLVADTDDGPVPRDQPLVVDRRPPPALPVRHRGRARDPRRRARPAAAKPVLRGRDAAVLERPRRGLLGARVAAVGPWQLRQGRAGTGHARLARHRARALSRRAGRRRVSVAAARAAPRSPSARSTRARAGRGAGHRRARALADVALRALGPDPGDRGRRHDGRVPRRARRPHGAGDDEPARRRAPCGRRRAGPTRRRGRPRARGRADRTRAPPRPARRRPPHDGFDADTARLDPGTQAGAALRAVFAVAAEHGFEAFGIWTAGAVRTHDRVEHRPPPRRGGDRRVHEGHLP